MAAQKNNRQKASQPVKKQGSASILGRSFSRRDIIILLLFLALALWVFARLFALTVIEAEALSAEGSRARTSTVAVRAGRGTIYDRNGNVLATSVDATTIYANPSKIDNPIETAEILGEVLEGTAEEYYELLTANPESTFVYIAKKTDPTYEHILLDVSQEYLEEEVLRYRKQGDDIPAEIITPLTGIEYLPDTRREYPKGNIGAQIIGAVNDEGEGISGLEQTYDSILRGVDGVRVVEEAKQASQNSNPLPMINSVVKDVDPVAGSDIIISIDIEMQQYLELNLEAVATQRETDDASAILLDGSTGEIIATASIPLYDRKNITTEQAQNGATTAKAITQPYEPGSTFKAIIAGVALEQGLMTADDTLYCPSSLQIYDHVVKDSVERLDTEMTLRDIIAYSSNVGVSLIEQQVGDELFYDYLLKCGLGDYSHVDYPGETRGNMAAAEDWTAIQASNITFGQGIEASVLQMASIYGAIANDGEMVQPHFLVSRPQYDQEITYNSKQVFEAQTARDLEDLLAACVEYGYGKNAAIEGYRVVGKTGTAEQSNQEGGYSSSKGSYHCSFVGYLDDSSSNYVFMSNFNNPSNYSNSPATPFFSVVMSFMANRYMVQPQEEAPLVTETAVSTAALSNTSESTGAAVTSSVVVASNSALKPPTPKDWVLDTSG